MAYVCKRWAVRHHSYIPGRSCPFIQRRSLWTDPDSPHYDDQADKLFSKGLLKPTWYQKEELMRNLESGKRLRLPL